jgi:hypothetical protein
MEPCILNLLLEYIFSLFFTKGFIVVRARASGASTTPFFLAAYFAEQNTKFGGGGKRGRAKIPSSQHPSFLPARAFSLARACPPKPRRRGREARHQFCLKKVRVFSNKGHQDKTFFGFLRAISWAAQSAAHSAVGFQPISSILVQYS